MQEKVSKELRLGRIAGPFGTPTFETFVTPSLGVVPKKESGAYRMIQHLSHPPGVSVNDGIPFEKASVQYQIINHAIDHVKNIGRGSYKAKTDIAEAFRIIPIKPSRYHLMGIHWQRLFYYDRCLAMGLRSFCSIFEQLSTAIHWLAVHQLGIEHMVHFIDDFLLVSASRGQGQAHLCQFIKLCSKIGVPIAAEKTFAPSTTMTFLGYEIDSICMEVRLPLYKLTKCQELIHTCCQKPKLTLRQLQSILGILNFACLPGRAFLRRLAD